MAGKSMKPGGGGRFAKLVSKLEQQGMSHAAATATAAKIGREKYGDKQMNVWAAKGRKRK